MRTIVDHLRAAGIVCKKLTPIPLKELGSRKKVAIYLGVDTDGYYCSVWHLSKKSRILRKEAEELFGLHARLERHADTRITRNYIRIDAPLCSKAKALMEEKGWRFL